MVAPNLTPEQMVTEARRIYDDVLKSRLEPRENGKFLVLNIDNGEYELDENDVEASSRAAIRFGDARLVTLRIGHHAAYRLGASLKTKG